MATDVFGLIGIWEQDQDFCRIYEEIRHYTIIDLMRLFILHRALRAAVKNEGDIAEVGVYKGGSAKLIAKSIEATGKKVYLFDTFTGMPPTDKNKDLHKEGDFGDTSAGDVIKFLKDCPNVIIYPGFFPKTAEPVKGKKFCFVHIDCDIYKSVRDACEFFFPRIVPGGMMLFDDYGAKSCPGARMAVDEFFKGRKEILNEFARGQCLVVKEM